ncbi:hypothetical protein BDA99DRAFT_532111 [Phascolomyces articulosus]|uniref:Uncharacterized protein n=1 Tax=Phascolomyces articulosus TaxID=60185 RepID=A0AAD5KPR6_9FUNG|nr:hypothetical protein BDA99DRAFT_532111 [Phascolomyces articulosus]
MTIILYLLRKGSISTLSGVLGVIHTYQKPKSGSIEFKYVMVQVFYFHALLLSVTIIAITMINGAYSRLPYPFPTIKCTTDSECRVDETGVKCNTKLGICDPEL